METIDLKSLSEEQRNVLIMQYQAEEREKREKVIQGKKALVDLEDEAVNDMIREAEAISNNIAAFKRRWIDRLEPLKEMKVMYTKASPNQESYTYGTKDGKKKVMVKQNMANRYDDGIQAGIDFAKEWLNAQVVDEKSGMLTDIIEELLAKGGKGTYSPDSLMKFVKRANEKDDPLLKKAADCILESLREEATSVAIRMWKIDDRGIKRPIPLSATEA